MRNFNFFSLMAGVGIGILASVIAIFIEQSKKDHHKCEFTVPYQVYPALTITCEGPGRPPCDTIYTYADWGSR